MISLFLFWGTYLGGYIAAITRLPIYAFVVYQAIYFFNPQKRWWGSSIPELSYSYYTVALMGLLMLIKWKESSQNKLLNTPQTKWIYAFLLLHAIAYSYAVLPIRHDLFFSFFLNLIITITIAYKLITNLKELHIAILGYVAGASYLSYYIIQVGRNRGNRVEGVGTVDSPDSNGVAAALAPAIVFGIYYLWRSDLWWKRGLALISLAFIANALVLVNSRGAVLGIIVGAGYFMYRLFYSKERTNNQRKSVVLLLVVGLCGAAYVVDKDFIDRFMTVKNEAAGVNRDSETGSTRIIFWKAAYDLALDHPVGTGIYGFNYYSSEYIPADTYVGQKLRTSGGIKSVHSSWFSTLAELGFTGLFVLIMIFASSFKALKRCKQKLIGEENIYNHQLIHAIQGSLLTFMVTMSFLDRHRAVILFILILFSMSAYNIFVDKNERGEAPSKRA